VLSSSKRDITPTRPFWARFIIFCLVFGSIMYIWPYFFSPFSEGWLWKPHVASLLYSLDGDTPKEIILIGKNAEHSPTILFNTDKILRIHNVNIGLFPSSTQWGGSIIKYENTEHLSQTADHPRIRLRATIRTNWGGSPKAEWYDEKNAWISDWILVSPELREVIWQPEWRIEEDWDMLRIQIEVDGKGFDETNDAIIQLKPADGALGWNIRHNIFSNAASELGILGVWRPLFIASAAILFVIVTGLLFKRNTRH
jgi:hypothetical protein